MGYRSSPAGLPLLLGLILAVSLLPTTWGVGSPVEIYDRECRFDGAWNYVKDHMPIGQVFYPRLATLTKVEVLVESKWGGQTPFTVKVRKGSITGPVIASKNFVMGPGASGWVALEIDPPAAVDPGQPYVIELSTGYPLVWHASVGGACNGHAITDGTSDSIDYLYRTAGLKPDFDVELNETEVTLRQGESVQVEVSLTSLYRGYGIVPIQASPDLSDKGVTIEFDDDSLNLPPGGEVKTTMTITASEDADVGDYDIGVVGTLSGYWGFVSDQADLTIHVEEAPRDFDIQISPSGMTVEAGSAATFTVEVTPVGNFDQTVHLSVTGLPEGATYSFSRTSGVPPFSSTLTIVTEVSTPEGTSLISVTGSSGGKAHVATARLTVERTVEPDFSLSVSPGSLTVPQGGVANFTVEISPVGGFSDPITVSVEGLPPDATFSITQTGAYAAVLSVRAGESVGSFVLTVTASGGGKTHTTSVTLQVTPSSTPTSTPPPGTPPQGEFDFSLQISPESVSVAPGDAVTFTVTLQSTGGTPQPVSLTVSGLPSDYSYALSPETVTPTGVATLEVRTSSTTGSFTVTVTATGGGKVKTATATLSVESGQPGVPARCVIATAAYGSEMAPQVQMLRQFRDTEVAATFAGSAFLKVFNAFYYSWSPPVARFISERPGVAAAVRVTLYPLVGILSLSEDLVEAMGGPSELSITASGVLASGLLGLSYLLVPMAAALRLTRTRIRRWWLAAAGTAAASSAVALAAGVSLTAEVLAAAGSAGLVLSTLALAPMAAIWVGLALSRKGL